MTTHVQEAITTVELGTLRDTHIEPDPSGTIRFEDVFHDTATLIATTTPSTDGDNMTPTTGATTPHPEIIGQLDIAVIRRGRSAHYRMPSSLTLQLTSATGVSGSAGTERFSVRPIGVIIECPTRRRELSCPCPLG